MKKNLERLYNGLVKENPTFVQMLGMCPTLAVTASALDGFGMGIATTIILTLSNMFISLLRKIIPDKVRIPAFIVIIASFVTMVQFLMQAYVPSLNKSLGVFIPLIVVNCIILGRAESYASKNPVIPSIFDGIGMGLGFTVGLTTIGIIRELLGKGTIFGLAVTKSFIEPIGIFGKAPGAFIVLAFLIAIINKRNIIKAKKTGTKPELCSLADCANCHNSMCQGSKKFDIAEAEAKKAEEVKKAETEVKKEETEVKKEETEVKKAEESKNSEDKEETKGKED